jgi:hypothetical protein
MHSDRIVETRLNLNGNPIKGDILYFLMERKGAITPIIRRELRYPLEYELAEAHSRVSFEQYLMNENPILY